VGSGCSRANSRLVLQGTPRLSETHWPQVAALLLADGRRGRPSQDHRRILTGILWGMHTGAPWRELPSEFGV
jgi:transposase